MSRKQLLTRRYHWSPPPSKCRMTASTPYRRHQAASSAWSSSNTSSLESVNHTSSPPLLLAPHPSQAQPLTPLKIGHLSLHLLRWVKAGFYCGQPLFRLLATESSWCILQTRSRLLAFVLYPVIVLWLMK